MKVLFTKMDVTILRRMAEGVVMLTPAFHHYSGAVDASGDHIPSSGIAHGRKVRLKPFCNERYIFLLKKCKQGHKTILSFIL